MNRHLTREAYFQEQLKLFPPFIIERMGTVPCAKSAEECRDKMCLGWTAQNQNVFDDGSLTDADWETWKKFVDIGW